MSVPSVQPPPSDFTTNIDNAYMTLRPGTTLTYENRDAGEVDTFIVTRDTAVIDGVTCIAVHDTARVNGILVEDTTDYFAQDSAGNVWYFGEQTSSFAPGNPVPISHDGSWIAGVDGASAGIAMLANPEVGDRYAQEHAPGVAEDRASVRALDRTVNVGYGSFDNVLQTRDVNPLHHTQEQKHYVRGVGNVLTTNADGDYEQLIQVKFTGTDDDDVLQGYAGGDLIEGLDGDDRLAGGNGNDTLFGGYEDDRLSGGSGFDRLDGGAADDTMRGGGGGDRFVFGNLADGHVDTDTIADYRLAQVDVIELAGGVGSIASETFAGGVWTLTLVGDGDKICLSGVVDTNGDGHITDNLLFG